MSARFRILASCVTIAVLSVLIGCSGTGQPARFPHAPHLRSGAVTCTNCHAVSESKAVGQLHEPGYDICRKCHNQNVGPGTKYAYDLSSTVSASADFDHVLFSHQGHTPRTQGQCVRCHRAGAESDRKPSLLLPAMADCLRGCHQPQYDKLQCTKCHPASQLSKLRPETDVAHGQNYVRKHSADAARKPQLCKTCHSEQFCTDCHDPSTGLRVELRRLDDVNGEYTHRADFVSRHAIEARSRPTACVRCHTPSSCDTCHLRNHVSGNGADAVSPHPAQWSAGDPGNPNFHGRAARRQIIECASCHDQGPATNCIRCHRVGGFGGNPHPSGWRSNQDPQSAEMCQFCHSR